MSAQVEDSSPPGQLYCPQCEKHFSIGERCPTDGAKLVKINVPLDPLLGRDIDGRYTIIEKLGQGGMGAVYRASQHGLGREVAIKVVSAHLVTEPDVVKRFLREAKLASRLSHPNAVAVLEFGQTEDGLFYLVMELVSGRTLDAVIKSEKVLRPERVVRIGMQVCDALEGAHSLSIVHRDLKPANIMLLAKGRDLVKVLDFGLAKVVGPDQTTTTMTNAGALLGTPAFMPPELALGQPCDGRADLYSLGVVLYLAGSGRLPFISESPHELIAMHGTDDAPPMPNVPPALGAVIDRMLSKDPAARYQTAADNREALEAALDLRNVMMTPVPGSGTVTIPDLGPFPAKTSDFAAMRTLAPGELDPLEVDTVAAPVSPSFLDASVPPKRKRRVLGPILLLLIALGGLGAAGYMFLLDKSSDQAASPTPPTKAEPQQLEPKPEPKPEPTPEPQPKPEPQPIASDGSGAGSAVVEAPKPDPTKKHPKIADKKKHPEVKSGPKSSGSTTTTAAVPNPPLNAGSAATVVTPPVQKDPPKQTPAGTGSGSGKMPF